MNLLSVIRKVLTPTRFTRPVGLQRAEYLARLDISGERPVPIAVVSQGIVDVHGNVFTNRQITVTGTTYTLTNDDCGAWIEFTNAGAITVTISADLNPLFGCAIAHEGTGTIAYTAASGATVQGQSASAGQYTQNTVYVVSNSNGSSADVRVY